MAPLTTLRREDQPGVLRITLTRPEIRNAFDEEVIAALTAIAREAAKDPTLRAIVLSGSGPSFCAGADLAWMMKAVAYSRQENLRDAEDLARMLELLDCLPVPVIARVHGAALGGGAGLVAVCDVAVAADTTMFAFSEARLGIVPAVISPYVVAKIGVSCARELFLTAARFDAHRAKEIGLVHAVVPEAKLDATIDTYLRDILACAPSALAVAKRLVREVQGRRPDEVIGLTTSTIAEQRTSPDGQEGMQAFLEKRKPRWIS
ncbi:MAG TPA: enoyl-CoA hydratase-related protein [Vicinamibacterales bacterium]|nr:enoyl-CoA hydratase-related protein [Vicinamibacterales bacterium]